MPNSYLRAISLTAGPLTYEATDGSIDARVIFHVETWTLSTPNIARITLFNLSDATAKSIKEGDPVVLKAGYVGNLVEIFRGQAFQLRKGKRAGGPTITYDLLAADGDVAHNQAAISTTVPAAAAGQNARTALDVILACAQTMKKYGVELKLSDKVQTYLKDPKWTYKRAKPLDGMVKDVLSDVCRWTNTQWSVQSGKLVIVPIRAPFNPDEDPIEVNAKTNMLGLPELTTEGVVVRTIIDGRITVGKRIHLNNGSTQLSEAAVIGGGGEGTAQIDPGQSNQALLDLDGVYVVLYRSVRGDTRGGEDSPWEFSLTTQDASGMSVQIDRLSPFYPAPKTPAQGA